MLVAPFSVKHHNQAVITKSKYFDSIRINPPSSVVPKGPSCEWIGCQRAATHRAPKGRSHEGEYLQFCVNHVREYNRGYNYFTGMKDDDIAEYQRETVTGNRPTRKFGVRGGAEAPASKAGNKDRVKKFDPFGMFGAAQRPTARAPKRTIGNAARKAFDTLGLDVKATSSEIKAKYKILVKRHHPDVNGGTRDAEDRLVEIIQAYRYLRGADFC